MNVKKILEYQKRDYELIKLQKGLESNENKKKYTEMVNIARDAQIKSTALDKDAAQIIEEFENLKKTYADNLKSAGVISNKDLSNSEIADINNVADLTNNIITNLGILEKKLLVQAERVNAILAEFEKTRKKHNEAKELHKKHKDMYEKEALLLEPQIKELEAELKKLEKELPEELFFKYKQRRQDRIYPVFVPLLEKTCGGCRMELPSANYEKLKKQTYLDCENCRRVIYISD